MQLIVFARCLLCEDTDSWNGRVDICKPCYADLSDHEDSIEDLVNDLEDL